tara:strand:+ start:503 stop:892 length:390 start_codon:yes stop_codon:yes gene_type:complete
MDDKDLLDIPEFLKREVKDTETIIEEDTEPKKEESWMRLLREHKEKKERRALRRKEIIKKKQNVLLRKKRKQHVDNFVMDAVRWKQDTFGKIRKFIYEDVDDNEIKSALKRLLKSDKLVKPSSRTYKVK